MAQYLVTRQPHFRDGMLHPVGSIITIDALDNEKEWGGYLVRQDPPKAEPPKPAVPAK